MADPGFQASPKVFVGFQSGVMVVAATYNVASPSFAQPGPLNFNYHFTSASFSVGALSIPKPALGIINKNFNANPYSLGALAFVQPSFQQKRVFSVAPFSLKSPVFSKPGIAQNYRLFANFYWLKPLAFAKPESKINFQIFPGFAYSLKSPVFVQIPILDLKWPIQVVPEYALSLRFASPRLQTQIVSPEALLPPTYLTQLEDATNVLVGMLNTLLSSIPAQPTPARDTLRIMVGVLRNNAAAAISGEILGTQLQQIFLQADAAGATFPGVEATRQYLMSHAKSLSVMTQIVFRAGLVMTLGLECKIISRLKFKTKDDVQQLIISVRGAFEDAKAVGIDEIDVLVYQSLNAMGGAIINHLAKTALQLPRFVTWQSRISMPSLYLANRIYADASRSDEIEDENDVVHPAFCPMNLRVLSYPPVGM